MTAAALLTVIEADVHVAAAEGRRPDYRRRGQTRRIGSAGKVFAGDVGGVGSDFCKVLCVFFAKTLPFSSMNFPSTTVHDCDVPFGLDNVIRLGGCTLNFP